MKKKLRGIAVWMVCAAVCMVALQAAAFVQISDGIFSGKTVFAKSDAPWAGEGTSSAPYLIAQAADLQALSDESNMEYWYYEFRQTADIDLDGVVWTPIGDMSSIFTGVYDGNGKTISNLTVNTGGEVYFSALFGRLGGDGSELKNITLTGINVNSDTEYANVGGLVAENMGTVKNCFVAGTVTGTTYAKTGGIAGCNKGGDIINSRSEAAVIGGDNAKVGGIAGENMADWGNAYIRYCSSAGSAVGGENSYVGGLVGNNGGNGTIARSSSSVTVNGGADCLAGGLLAYNGYNSKVDNSYSVGDVYGAENAYAGGFAAMNSSFASIRQCYSTGSANSQTPGYTGGLNAHNFSGVVADSYYLDTSADTSSGGTPLSENDMKMQSSFAGWAFGEVWVIEEGVSYPMLKERLFEDGDGSEQSPYLVDNAVRLDAVRNYIDNPDVYFMQIADIDLSGLDWAPIGAYDLRFEGCYNGGNFTISGMTVKTDTLQYAGLFGAVGEAGALKNIKLENTLLRSTEQQAKIGSLAGYNLGVIDGCKSEGVIEGGTYSFVGGLVGLNHGTVSNSYCGADVSVSAASEASVVGGIAGAGESYSCIINCAGLGSVQNPSNVPIGHRSYTGGIAGLIQEGSIVESCYFAASASGQDFVGGIAGALKNDSIIRNCYSKGTVSSVLTAGGLVGGNTNSLAEGCYTLSLITGGGNAGGIAGLTEEDGSLKNNVALCPAVNGEGGVGRITAVITSYAEISGNSAWAFMPLNGNYSAAWGEEDYHNGVSMRYLELCEELYTAFYQAEDSAGEYAWDCEEGKLPLLRAAAGIQDASFPVYLVGFELTGITPVNAVTVPYGAGLVQAITLLAQTTTVEDSAGQIYTVTLSWAIPEYAGNIAGDYTAIGTFDLPTGVEQTLPVTELKVTAIVTVQANIYTLTIIAGTGGNITVGAGGGYEAEDVIDISASPAEGYRFVSWSANAGVFANAHLSSTAFTMPESAATVTAVFALKEYTVTFDGAGGALLSGTEEQSVEHGQPADAPEYVRQGYSFAGWSADFSIIAAAVTVTAQWLLSSPTVAVSGGYTGNYDKKPHSVYVTASHAYGGAILSYQWYKGSVAEENLLSGQTGATLSVKDMSDRGTYYCRIAYTDGAQSGYIDSEGIEVNIIQDGSGLSAGAIAGIAAGAVIILMAAGYIALFAVWKKKGKKPLAFLGASFRKVNKLLFKAELDDIERNKE